MFLLGDMSSFSVPYGSFGCLSVSKDGSRLAAGWERVWRESGYGRAPHVGQGAAGASGPRGAGWAGPGGRECPRGGAGGRERPLGG